MANDNPESDQLLKFPCSFPIKIMGRDSPTFRDTVVNIVEKYAGAVNDDAVRTASSRNGNFISVTVTIDAESQRQLDEIYRELSNHDEVLVGL